MYAAQYIVRSINLCMLHNILCIYALLTKFLRSVFCDLMERRASSLCFHLILTGHRVSGPVINELNTYLAECGLYCLAKAPDCKSFNYRSGDHHRYSKNCQLINATKKTHPQNLLPDENYVHYEQLTLPKVFKVSL